LSLPPAEIVSRPLDNGLLVVAAPDHSVPVAALQLWVRAGSIYEGEKLGSGISHYLEHLAFKGHGGTSDGEIARRIEALGGAVNAYTSLDRTVFHIRLPAEGWREGLALLRRLVLEIEFDEASMAKEKEVVLREIEMGLDDPDRRLSRLLWGTAYQVHPYRYPVIGYAELVGALDRSEVEAYYRRWYVPNNMILIAAGDLDPEQLFAQAAEVFADDPRRDYPLSPIPVEPRQVGARSAGEIMDVADTRLALAFHIPSLHHDDVYALDVLAILAGRGRSSRLYRRLREEEGLVLGISASSYTPFYPGLFTVGASCRPELEEAAASRILEELERFAREDVTPQELERARRRVIMDYLGTLTTVEGRASDLGLSLLYAGGTDFSRDYVRRVSGVEAGDIRRVARRYFRPAGLTAVAIRPVGGDSAREVSLPPAGEITRHRLDNGLTLLVREDHALPLVSLRAVFRGGVLAESDLDNGVGNFTSRMLLKGTSRRSAAELAAEVENLGGSLSSYSARSSCGAHLSVPAGCLPEALGLLGDILTDSVFPESEVERERELILAGIRAETDRPRGLAARLLLGELFPDSPFRLPPAGTEETVAALAREALVSHWRRIYCGNNSVIAVFGDVRTAEAVSLAERFLGHLRPGERLEVEIPPPPAAAIRRESGEKQGVRQEAVLLGFPGVSVDDPDRYPLEVLAEYFSGLSSPLFLSVRVRAGLAYAVGAYQVLGLIPGGFVFYAETVPGEGERVASLILEEIERLRREGIPPEELELARRRLVGQDLFRREDNDSLSFSASLDELYGLGYAVGEDYAEKIEAVTPERVKEVAEKYLGEEDYALVTVGPVSESGPAPQTDKE